MPLKIHSKAFHLIVLLGLVSLFADITYEGARSILGPYLAFLGATGVIVGVVAGFGEFVSSGFRIVAGKLSDHFEKPWILTILGYSINLFAVPCMAFVDTWQGIAVLIMLERLGKSLRNPPRDSILSWATKSTGRGIGFGIHQLFDRIGAVTGPLIMALFLAKGLGYKPAFIFLFVPTFISLFILLVSSFLFKEPKILEEEPQQASKPLSITYFFYVIAASLVAVGYVDFALIAFHFNKTGCPIQVIPLLYACSMAVDGLSSLFLGKLYDKIGLKILPWVVGATALFAPFVFLGNSSLQFFGIILWGVGLGMQESIMRACIADLTHKQKRGTAYGLFQFSFGISWFLGSAMMGLLYDLSPLYLVMFSLIFQVASIPFFLQTVIAEKND